MDWKPDDIGNGLQFINQWTFFTNFYGIAIRHHKQSNILFMDGHVKGYGPPALPVFSTTDAARTLPWLEASIAGSPDF